MLSGGYVASGLVDMTKFFDYVGVDWLLKTAVGLSFPHTALILGLEVMMSYRLVAVQNQIEEVGMAGNGVVPGDPFATSFARCFLYPALPATTRVASSIGADLKLRVFVDDIRARCTASN